MSATTFLRRRNYAGDTCKNEEFPAATFGKKVCIFRYLGVAKNKALSYSNSPSYKSIKNLLVTLKDSNIPVT